MKHQELHVESLSEGNSKGKIKPGPKCNDPMSETRPFHAILRLRRDRGVDVNASLAVEVFAETNSMK
jgi:hypothetical protein